MMLGRFGRSATATDRFERSGVTLIGGPRVQADPLDILFDLFDVSRCQRRPRRMLHRLCTAVSVALAVGGFAMLAFLGLGPRTSRYQVLTVLSGSMTPRLPIGAVVIATPERPSQLRVGQILVYQIPVDDHHVVSHRVVQILRGGDRPIVRTKGDANNAPDPWTAEITSPVAWRVRAVLPALGSLLIWLRQPLLRRTLVLGFPFLAALLWIADIWRGSPPEPT